MALGQWGSSSRSFAGSSSRRFGVNLAWRDDLALAHDADAQQLVIIRTATAEDLPAIIAIYNHEVLHGVATFDTVVWMLEDRQDWFRSHESPRHPLVVAQDAGNVIGWASLSPWSDRCAYARAAEVSLYVHHEHRRRGIGRALLTELIERARRAGLRVLLARIESGGQVSLNLCRSLGFKSIGTMRRVGEKFGRLLDVELLDLHLDG